MDVEYRDKDIEISIRNVNKNTVGDKEFENVMKIITLFKEFATPFKEAVLPIVKQALPEVKEKPEKVNKEDRPVIRDRIPNQVDLSTLEIKKAVTNEPMIRCPHCGQASKTIVCINDCENYLLRKITKNGKKTFETVMVLEDQEAIDNICMPEGANITDYHSDIMKIKQSKKLQNTDLNVSNETMLLCPCCKEKEPFSKWVDAFQHPLEFGFETETLCDICGGEAVKAIDENKHEIIQCESCGNKETIV